MYVFNAAGQSIRGKWVEVTADRVTREFAGRGELSYDIAVKGNSIAGSATFRSYDVNGTLVDGPSNSTLASERVTLHSVALASAPALRDFPFCFGETSRASPMLADERRQNEAFSCDLLIACVRGALFVLQAFRPTRASCGDDPI
jgi:hypothetical protein